MATTQYKTTRNKTKGFEQVTWVKRKLTDIELSIKGELISRYNINNKKDAVKLDEALVRAERAIEKAGINLSESNKYNMLKAITVDWFYTGYGPRGKGKKHENKIIRNIRDSFEKFGDSERAVHEFQRSSITQVKRAFLPFEEITWKGRHGDEPLTNDQVLIKKNIIQVLSINSYKDAVKLDEALVRAERLLNDKDVKSLYDELSQRKRFLFLNEVTFYWFLIGYSSNNEKKIKQYVISALKSKDPVRSFSDLTGDERVKRFVRLIEPFPLPKEKPRKPSYLSSVLKTVPVIINDLGISLKWPDKALLWLYKHADFDWGVCSNIAIIPSNPKYTKQPEDKFKSSSLNGELFLPAGQILTMDASAINEYRFGDFYIEKDENGNLEITYNGETITLPPNSDWTKIFGRDIYFKYSDGKLSIFSENTNNKISIVNNEYYFSMDVNEGASYLNYSINTANSTIEINISLPKNQESIDLSNYQNLQNLFSNYSNELPPLSSLLNELIPLLGSDTQISVEVKRKIGTLNNENLEYVLNLNNISIDGANLSIQGKAGINIGDEFSGGEIKIEANTNSGAGNVSLFNGAIEGKKIYNIYSFIDSIQENNWWEAIESLYSGTQSYEEYGEERQINPPYLNPFTHPEKKVIHIIDQPAIIININKLEDVTNSDYFLDAIGSIRALTNNDFLIITQGDIKFLIQLRNYFRRGKNEYMKGNKEKAEKYFNYFLESLKDIPNRHFYSYISDDVKSSADANATIMRVMDSVMFLTGKYMGFGNDYELGHITDMLIGGGFATRFGSENLSFDIGIYSGYGNLNVGLTPVTGAGIYLRCPSILLSSLGIGMRWNPSLFESDELNLSGILGTQASWLAVRPGNMIFSSGETGLILARPTYNRIILTPYPLAGKMFGGVKLTGPEWKTGLQFTWFPASIGSIDTLLNNIYYYKGKIRFENPVELFNPKNNYYLSGFYSVGGVNIKSGLTYLGSADLTKVSQIPKFLDINVNYKFDEEGKDLSKIGLAYSGLDRYLDLSVDIKTYSFNIGYFDKKAVIGVGNTFETKFGPVNWQLDISYSKRSGISPHFSFDLGRAPNH